MSPSPFPLNLCVFTASIYFRIKSHHQPGFLSFSTQHLSPPLPFLLDLNTIPQPLLLIFSFLSLLLNESWVDSDLLKLTQDEDMIISIVNKV